MASSAIAAMLDELMGRDRNLAPTEKAAELRWDDSEVCKYYLVEFCPHELFTNTRADLGQCDKIHDEHLRKDYKNSSRHGRLGYEEDFLRYLQTLINDVEKRIRRGHQRLALNSMQGASNGNPVTPKEEKIKMLTERINDLVQKAEELGCEGKVEEAQGIMKLCDQLNEERTSLQKNTGPDPFNEPLKAMEVCNVCGALLVVGDAQQRVDEHIMGKQHSGYARIRAYVDGKRMQLKEKDEEREARLRKEREDREKEREKEREERKKREEERKKEKEEKEKEREARRERDREREREKRRRSRSRSKSRRSSRDRRKRSRSGSRSKRHRSRSKSRDHHRSRRHRSRSGSRSSRSSKHKKSRSKDRSSKKSSQDRSKSKEPSSKDGKREDKEEVRSEMEEGEMSDSRPGDEDSRAGFNDSRLGDDDSRPGDDDSRPGYDEASSPPPSNTSEAITVATDD